MVNIDIEAYDINGDPVPGELFINEVLIDSGTTFSLEDVNTGNNYYMQFIPDQTDPEFKEYAQTFYFPNNLSGQTITIPLVITAVDDYEPRPAFIFFRRDCSARYDFYLTSTTYYTTLFWDFGNNYSNFITPTNDFAEGHPYNVTLQVSICEDSEVQGCCGSLQYNQNCNIEELTTPLTPPHTKPKVQFLVDVFGKESCNCENNSTDICVPEGNQFDIVPQIELNDEDCDSTFTIELYENDTLLHLADYSSVEDVPNYTSVKSSPGKYDYTIKVTTCCGECTYTKSIIIGDPVTLKRLDCHIVQLCYTRSTILPQYNREIQILVKDYAGNIIDTYLESVSEPNLNSFNIALPEDGIYRIEVSEFFVANPLLFPSVGDYPIPQYTKEFIVFEFCSIRDCYEKLVQKLICPECDCQITIHDKNDLNNKVNKFVMLASAFYSSTLIQFGETFGMFYFEEKYLNTLKNQSEVLKALKSLCGECGISTKLTNISKDCECLVKR